jgi:hypothetical protein
MHSQKLKIPAKIDLVRKNACKLLINLRKVLTLRSRLLRNLFVQVMLAQFMCHLGALDSIISSNLIIYSYKQTMRRLYSHGFFNTQESCISLY